ncbi:hypothetical protein BU23DRAFT_476045 [Bimuria novae-zelandiae CBS 107.79]|uniref:Uncharacterized protein n=1 Tax=Bimuria novae-zelandiae CBS 107.79 TaxID=1447943 RepID=A0A6A5UYC7_9PLEO|nr:hypothetical protein BU23DRAFT_476045 [Bimuria novae-zelandiae CBS 107.79]
MDGKPLGHWKLPIQPNSLIAVFSTVGKTGLLVPLSECIVQLKWVYFHSNKAKPLRRMHVFDAASRGPWGSFTFLLNIRLLLTAWLAYLGAITVVLRLAYEPFTQQMLQLYSKSAPLANMTGTVKISTAFSDFTGSRTWT